jgi:transcription-repair coupling factor (superfamily II helicase)
VTEVPNPLIPDVRADARSIDEIARMAVSRPRLDVVGAAGGSLAALVARVARTNGGRALVVVEDREQKRAFASDLAFHWGATSGAAEPTSVLRFPAHDLGPYDEIAPDRRSIMRRSGMLFRLAFGAGWTFLVVSADALTRRLMPKAAFEAACLPLAVGDTVDWGELLAALERGGYHRSPLVEEAGTFAVRGSIIDVFPPYLARPVRVDFSGFTVERIRSFDPATQEGGEEAAETWVHPARPALLPTSDEERSRIAARIRELCDEVDKPTSQTDRLIEDALAGRIVVGADGLTPAFHEPLGSLLDYLPADVTVFLENPAGVRAAWHKSEATLAADFGRKRASGEPAFPPADHAVPPARVEEWLLGRRLVAAHPLAVCGGDPSPLERCDDPVDLGAASTADLGEKLRNLVPAGDKVDLLGPLAGHLRALDERGVRTIVVGHTAGQIERLAAMLRGRGLEPRIAEPGAPVPGRGLFVAVGELGRGCLLPADAVCWITEEEIFGKRARRRARPAAARASLDSLRLSRPGDLMVHADHGIGRYEGLVRQRVRGAEMDFVLLSYRDGDKLYVPVYRLNQVQRYSGGEGQARLDKLGGEGFARTRSAVRQAAFDMAGRLLDLYARRAAAERGPFPAPDDLQRAFEASFPFEETDDQLRAIDTVMADLDGARPMDRLICGDVGFGKTEVALRAAFRVVMAGRQVAVLVPTTVLAQQHFQTFSSRFKGYPVRVESLSRFKSAAENASIAAGLKDGTVDIAIGTHRLLSPDVHFKRLGLLVIDEEHRFGVAHKERIRELRASVDTMVLTATPIPRTLHMSLSGLKDISLIATAPSDRRPIKTFLCHDDPALLREAMEKELAREGQIFFVHNRVRDIGEVAERVGRLVPGARVVVGHGQMKEESLERVMLDFVAGRYDVLVCTSIIESGLDIPRANTVIIDRADTFGLAQLYQIRGRVGRSHKQAHAYLIVPPLESLSGDARARVEALARFTDLGSGFAVATMDLEIRGAGNLLGPEQSGDVSAVGFEMFCDLVAEATAEIQGRPVVREVEPELTFERPGFFPDTYMPDVGQRLHYYKRLAQAESEDEVGVIAAEIRDRFGPLPADAGDLVKLMLAKVLCRALRIPGLESAPARAVVHLHTGSRVDPDRVAAMVREARGTIRLTAELKLIVKLPQDGEVGADGAIRILRRLGGHDNNPRESQGNR